MTTDSIPTSYVNVDLFLRHEIRGEADKKESSTKKEGILAKLLKRRNSASNIETQPTEEAYVGFGLKFEQGTRPGIRDACVEAVKDQLNDCLKRTVQTSVWRSGNATVLKNQAIDLRDRSALGGSHEK